MTVYGFPMPLVFAVDAADEYENARVGKVGHMSAVVTEDSDTYRDMLDEGWSGNPKDESRVEYPLTPEEVREKADRTGM